MIRLVLVLWLLGFGAATAAPILVKSGEHDGFTRLVMEYGYPVKWTLGRTDDGYALHIEGPSKDYDFSEAFKLIGKSRLAAIWSDEQSSDLRIGIACACHAIPFEFRPGILVIDLRDGPPPKGSSFENTLEGAAAPNLGTEVPAPQTASQPGYNWQVIALQKLQDGSASTGSTPLQIAGADPELQGLRTSLINQIGRGASEGLVDVVLPKGLPDVQEQTVTTEHSASRVSLGEMPGISITNGLPEHSALSAEGGSCVTAESLDIATWGDDRPVSDQIAEATGGIVGEFDKVDATALEKAIRFELYIGFGAEARQLMQAFPTDLPDQPIWYSLSRLVDGEGDSSSTFAGQAGCDGPAALWSVLADPTLTDGAHVNADAIYLAFSALPVAMRRNLGPLLADRFLALNDQVSATKIRDAVLRAPGDPGPSVELMDVELQTLAGETANAEQKLSEMVANPGPDAPLALIALVESRVAQDMPIEPSLVPAIEAVAKELAGTKDQAAADRAVILAQAASGDFDAAFTGLEKAPDAEPDLWRLLSRIGQDDAVLSHAVRNGDAGPANATDATAAELAQRLLTLGMADSALLWLPDESRADPVLLAQIQLQRNDGRGVLRALTGNESAEALDLRAKALALLGDDLAAARVIATSGDTPEELRAVAHAEAWQEVGARGAEPWKSVAASLAPQEQSSSTEGSQTGPLARGKQLAETSADTRAKIDLLLGAVASP